MNQFSTRSSSCAEDSGQIGNTDSLYSKVQRVYLKSKNKEERQRDLRVTVDILTGLSPVCNQNLSLQLTDDEDPFFLYALLITEEDFKSLKSQQGLLVDFDHFPGQFVRLLEQCKTGHENQGPRFLLILDGEERDSVMESRHTHLKIVETNHFKHLCHLDLKIGGGSDADIKKLMASKIRHLKDVLLVKEKELTQTLSQLNDTSRRLELKSREMEDLQHHWSEEKNLIFTQNLMEVTKERDRLSSAQTEWQMHIEKDKREVEIRNQNIITNLESQITLLTSQNQALFEKNCQEESAKREGISQLDALEKEIATSQREIAILRKQNSKLDLDYHEKEKQSNSLRTKVAVIEQELKDKAVLLNKQQELLRNANEQKIHLEETLREKDKTLQRKHTSLQSLSEELVKGNEILTKLQDELVAVKSKLKLRTSIALEQERLLETEGRDRNDAHTKVTQYEQCIKDLEATVAKLQESLTAAEVKVAAKEKQIRNNDNVIHWLNRQLAGVQNETREPPSQGLTSTPMFLQYKQHGSDRLNSNLRASSTINTTQMPTPSVSSVTNSKFLEKHLPSLNDNKVGSVTKGVVASDVPKLPLNTNVILGKKAPTHPPIPSAYFPKSSSS